MKTKRPDLTNRLAPRPGADNVMSRGPPLAPDAFLVVGIGASAGGLDLRAESGRVKITSEALALAVLFRAAVQRRGAEPVVPAPDEPAPVRATENETGARRIRDRSPLALGVLGGLAMVVGAGLHALLANGRRT